jgi:hypothetical protein
MIIVPPTDTKTPAILSDPDMLMIRNASILMQELNDGRTNYTVE